MKDIGSGDKLARGHHSAQFEGPQVSQEKWNDIWGDSGETEIERLRKKRVTVTEEESVQIEEQKKEESKLVEEFRQVKKEIPKTVPFRAVQDRVVVVRIEDEETDDLLVETPDEAKEKPSEGVVVAVGPGKFVQGVFVPTSTKVGERVMFGKYSGQEVSLGRDLPLFLVLREEDVFLVRNLNQEV